MSRRFGKEKRKNSFWGAGRATNLQWWCEAAAHLLRYRIAAACLKRGPGALRGRRGEVRVADRPAARGFARVVCVTPELIGPAPELRRSDPNDFTPEISVSLWAFRFISLIPYL